MTTPPVTPPKVSQLPEPPIRTDGPSDFSEKGDEFLGGLPAFGNQINAVADYIQERADDAADSAVEIAGIRAEVATDKADTQAASNAAGVSAQSALDSAGGAAQSAQASSDARDGAEQAQSMAEGYATAAGSSAQAASISAQDAAQSAHDAASAARGEIAPAIHTSGTKTELADDDEIAITDSEDSFVLGRVRWANLKTEALKDTGVFPYASASYTYNEQGLVTKITTPGGDTEITYNPDGTVNTVEHPSGRVETYSYDTAGNITGMTAGETTP